MINFEKFHGDQRGLVNWIIIIIIAIIVLSYFGFDIRAIIEDDNTQNNVGYVWGGVVYVWETYLSGPFDYLWNDIFIDLIWDTFIDAMQRIKNGGSIQDF
ncbi:MAG: hypothetical protein V1851_01930 [Patescibacteria group bacterium]